VFPSSDVAVITYKTTVQRTCAGQDTSGTTQQPSGPSEAESGTLCFTRLLRFSKNWMVPAASKALVKVASGGRVGCEFWGAH
jgi:hypothetical protein